MRHFAKSGMSIMLCALVLLGSLRAQSTNNYSTLVNFNTNGLQISRFDSVAVAIDSHGSEIAYFNGVFYLYGTNYGCGYEWGNPTTPFCGFKVYTTKDLVNWIDRGFLLMSERRFGSHVVMEED
jgi:hypothetical protein